MLNVSFFIITWCNDIEITVIIYFKTFRVTVVGTPLQDYINGWKTE